MGVFEFIIALVLISTVGKVLMSRRGQPRELKGGAPRRSRAQLEPIQEVLDNLSSRVQRLEEERDFYRDLLESPGRPRGIAPPDTGDAESDDAGPP